MGATRWASLRHMKRIERIVVGVDLEDGRVGPTASLAIAQARAIALESGARIVLLHSTHEDELWNDDERTYEVVREDGDERVLASLEQVAAPLRDSGIRCEVVVTDEQAGLAIVRFVLRTGADLVILGKRIGKQRDGRHIGSVCLNVVRHCPCLVSVVKPGSDPNPRVIVAATDAGPVGRRVVATAADMAALCEATLHVVHAIQVGMEVQMEGDDAERAFVQRRRGEIRAAVEADASAAGFAGELHVHAGVTSPTRAVLDAVARLHPDLVVMGTVSRGGIPGLLVGNTAERLLGTLDCSLLVVKPHDFVSPVLAD